MFIQAAILGTQPGLDVGQCGIRTSSSPGGCSTSAPPATCATRPSPSTSPSPPTSSKAGSPPTVGDRVTVVNLPVQHPATTVELLIEAIEERLAHTDWGVALTCSPGAPWLVGVLDA